MFYLLIAIKSLDVLYGLVYDVIDGRYFGSILRTSESQRRKLVAERATRQLPLSSAVEVEVEVENKRAYAEGGELVCMQPQMVTTGLGLVLGAAMVIVAWVVYLIYSQGN